jgi:NAD(P)-dependent dehydrogenase (short-subunit alcohol dehydrogenase family)
MTDRNFDATSTTDQVLEGIDLSGQRVIVTGCSSGLGAESARALAAKGAAVTLTGRNLEKTQAVADAITASTGNTNLDVRALELDVPGSVRAFAKGWLADHDQLNLLINNAGVMACPLMRNSEGWENQFATNHVGHFLLTALLAPALRAGAPARIVNVSSGGHRFSDIDFDDVHFERRDYDKFVSYGQAKTANVLHAVELERRLGPDGVHAVAIHPGVILTELGRHMDEADIKLISDSRGEDQPAMVFKPVEAGAATQVYAATAPELEGRGALYLEDCQVSGTNPPDGLLGASDWALDPDRATRLWSYTEELLGESFDLG